MLRQMMTATLALSLGFAAPALAETPPNMLVIGTNLTSVRSFDPAANNARTPSELLANIYDNLVTLDTADLSTLKPMLATEWTVSDDGRTITMKLRDDATFSSGNPVTAEDAAWSIQRIIKLGQVGSTDLALWGFTADNVDEMVQATGPNELTIKLPEPVNVDLVLYSLAGSSVGIVDKTEAMAHEADNDFGSTWLSANPVGSGPFKLSTWRPNDVAIFDAREDYWGGAPGVARVAVRHIPESGNLRLQLESGDLDVAQYVSAGDLDALEKNPDISIENVPGLGFYYIALNQKDPDLSKPQVREAFQHAFDWQSVTDNLMKYEGFPWQSMIPKGMAGAPAEATDRYNYDPELSCKLLAEAGYPDGIKKVLNPSGAVHLAKAEAFQATAKKACIDLDLVPGEFVPAFRERTYEVLLGNSGARLPDPFAVATQYAYNPDNSDEARLGSYYLWRVGQQSDELNALVAESKSETDPEKRAAIFTKMDEVYQAMIPALVIFFQRTDPYVVRKGVEGYHGHTTWSTDWRGVTKG